MAEFKRRCDRKKRKTGNKPIGKLNEILSKIYPEETVKELMDRFTERGVNNG